MKTEGEISIEQINEKADEQLLSLVYSGNTRETASFVQSVAAVLNEKSTPTAGKKNANSEKSEEDKKKSIEVTDISLIIICEKGKKCAHFYLL